MKKKKYDTFKILAFLVIGLLMSTAALGVATQALMKFYFDKKMQQAYGPMDPKVKSLLLEDLDFLQKNPLFPKSSDQHNARLFLEKYIPYGKDKLDSAEVQNTRRIFAECNNEAANQLSVCVSTHPLLSKVDLGWMEELENFDHWSIYDKESVQALLIKAGKSHFLDRISLLTTLPKPDYGLFLNYATLNFMKNKDKDLKKAYARYWHHLFLLHRANDLVAANLVKKGITLGAEWQAQYPLPDAPIFSIEAADRYQRVAWAWIGILNSVWTQDLDPALAPYLTAELGVCATVSEPFGQTVYSDLLTDSWWPFEPNYSEPMARAQSIRLQVLQLCHTPELAVVVDPMAAQVAVLITENLEPQKTNEEKEWIEKGNQQSIQMPYLRRLYWGLLSTLAAPNYYRLYEEELEKKR